MNYSPTVETPQPDEAETIQGLNKAFDVILERTSQDEGRALRAVHAKSHGSLLGELTIDAGLPPELAQGLFAKPGTHKVVLRLSTNAGEPSMNALTGEIIDVDGRDNAIRENVREEMQRIDAE